MQDIIADNYVSYFYIMLVFSHVRDNVLSAVYST